MATATPLFTNRPQTASGEAPTRTSARQQISNRTVPPPAPISKPRDAGDIIREIQERRAREAAEKLAAAMSTESEEAHEALVERVANLYDADAQLTVAMNKLEKQKGLHAKKSAADQERLDAIQALTTDIETIQSERTKIGSENSLAHAEGLQRYNRRLEAKAMANSNCKQSASVANIRARVDAAIEDGFVVSTNQENYEFVLTEAKKAERPAPAFTFDRQYFMAVKLWDTEDVVAVSLAEMINDLQVSHDSEDDKTMVEVRRGGYYVSTQREPDGKGGSLPSGLEVLQKQGGFARRASAFLSGKGDFYALHVGREVVVIESRDKKFDKDEKFVGANFLAVKVSGPRTGRVLCTVNDPDSPQEFVDGIPQSRPRIARTSPANMVTNGHTVNVTDVSGIWWEKARQAFELELQREAETITFADLRNNMKGTVGVAIKWKTDAKDDKSPEVFLRFKLVGTGDGTFQAKDVYNDVLVKVDPKGIWLAKAIQSPQKLEVLNTGKWPAVAGLNKMNERDQRLDNLAEDTGAIRITKENVDDLTSIDQGKDGTYAVKAMVRNDMGLVDGERKFRKNPVGYLVQRTDSATDDPEVEIVGAVPGLSVSFANNLRGKHKIKSLPWNLKVILGSQYYGVCYKDAPSHLQLTTEQQQIEKNEAAAE